VRKRRDTPGGREKDKALILTDSLRLLPDRMKGQTHYHTRKYFDYLSFDSQKF